MRSRRLILLAALLLPSLAPAQDDAEVSTAVQPPDIPVYDQPPIPADGYLWTPGYWAWSPDVQDYYWVPGTWVVAPQPQFLWTPGYWALVGGLFLWHPGYWGPQVGFYGGVNYGYGYASRGYEGGYWQSNHFHYNTSANNLGNAPIANTYDKPVISRSPPNHTGFNGGGGIQAQPTPAQLAAAQSHHLPATPAQVQQIQTARQQPALRVGQNFGTPPIAATARPGAFTGVGVVGAKPVVTPEPVRGEPLVPHAELPPPTPRQGSYPTSPPANSRAAPPPATESRMMEPPRNAAPSRSLAAPTTVPPPVKTGAPPPPPALKEPITPHPNAPRTVPRDPREAHEPREPEH